MILRFLSGKQQKLQYIWLLVLLLPGFGGQAQNLPAGFSFVPVANGLDSPTAMAFAPDGRIFVTQQGGQVRIIKDGLLLPAPFAELAVESSGDRGLLGIALDPNFATNPYIYLYYTVPGSPAHNRASRFMADGDVVMPGSEEILVDVEPIEYAEIHNGGAMHFGPDGKLYIGIGDNASPMSAQDLDSYRGKLLRINPDGSVPADNPYPTGSAARRSIWAYGFRNPFTFSIHPVTGRILVNDVGYTLWEEINDATTAGQNFGWPTAEGNDWHPEFKNPLYTYAHGDSGDEVGCAITGGTFFSPIVTTYPADWVGRYFFQDFCNQWINYLAFSGSTAVRYPFATGIPQFSVGLCEGTDGNLYFISRSGQEVYKLIYTSNEAPAVTSQPGSVSAFDGQPATFRVSVSGAMPLMYQWQRNGIDIPDATNLTYTVPSVSSAVAGDYTVLITNSFGNVVSNTATLTSLGYNAAPVAHILSPTTHSRYQAGTTVSFSATATDAEDGVLPASAFSWRVDFHHNIHRHDGPPVAIGTASGSFYIPNRGETSTNVWYRLILTVTDASGLRSKDSVDIDPLLGMFTLNTDPPGLLVTVDGVPAVTPVSQSFVAGMLINLGTAGIQAQNNTSFQFMNWSPTVPPGGNTVVLPISTTYTAAFTALPGGSVPLTLFEPQYDCQTGLLTFRYAGGDGSMVTFQEIGTGNWLNSAQQTVSAELRANPTAITLYASQSNVIASIPFSITAYCVNQPPVLQSTLPTLTATAGMAFAYQLPANTFTDPEGGPVALTTNSLPASLSLDAATGAISGVPTAVSAGTVVVTITATDNRGASTTATLSLIIWPAPNDCSAVPPGEAGAEIASIRDGDWADPTIWSCGCVPSACNPVRVKHIISVPGNYTATAHRLIYASGGRLLCQVAARLRLGN